jgi:hypothetical protein
MPILDRLASTLGRSDEVPNQELAAEIAARGDTVAVAELIDLLTKASRPARHDAIKVLYEIAYVQPGLIAPHTSTLIDVIGGRDNRLIWGAMTALGSVASLVPQRIWSRVDEVIAANDAGSVITQDWGVRTLAAVAAADQEYERRLFPYLLDFVRRCIPRDLPKHAESMLVAANARTTVALEELLGARAAELSASQGSRLRRIQRQLAARRDSE